MSAGTSRRPHCAAGGPGCTSRVRELHPRTGPAGIRTGYYTCPRCGWISAPFTLDQAEEV